MNANDANERTLCRPFWIYIFVLPLVPLWAPFVLFISVAYRNSRLARYASASALFGCINIVVREVAAGTRACVCVGRRDCACVRAEPRMND